MPKNELTAPESAAPVDRLALSVTSSRPIDQASGITPSWDTNAINAGFCFADGAAPSVWHLPYTFPHES